VSATPAADEQAGRSSYAASWRVYQDCTGQRL
jgi:hypothetical protein